MSSGASWAYAKPRSASSSCIEETPRSNRTPSTRSMPRRSSTSGISSYTACTRVARSPNGASRSPDSFSACGSRSTATSRTSGNWVSSASLCPPRPSVASTTTAPGREIAGASASMHRCSITGTCLGPGSLVVMRGGALPRCGAARRPGAATILAHRPPARRSGPWSPPAQGEDRDRPAPGKVRQVARSGWRPRTASTGPHRPGTPG